MKATPLIRVRATLPISTLLSGLVPISLTALTLGAGCPGSEKPAAPADRARSAPAVHPGHGARSDRPAHLEHRPRSTPARRAPAARRGLGSGGGHGAHGGQHRFRDAERWAKHFESPDRDRWQKPEAVIRLLGIQPDWRIVDIGSATGYFAVRFARRVPRGFVWGIDIEPDMVRYLNARAKREGLTNLESRLAGAGIPPVPAGVNLIFLCNTYHHIPVRVRYFRALAGRLASGGRIAVVDYKQGRLPVGPPERHRVSPEQLHKELTAAGLQRMRLDTNTLPYQYVAIYGAGSSAPPSSPSRNQR